MYFSWRCRNVHTKLEKMNLLAKPWFQAINFILSGDPLKNDSQKRLSQKLRNHICQPKLQVGYFMNSNFVTLGIWKDHPKIVHQTIKVHLKRGQWKKSTKINHLSRFCPILIHFRYSEQTIPQAEALWRGSMKIEIPENSNLCFFHVGVYINLQADVCRLLTKTNVGLNLSVCQSG